MLKTEAGYKLAKEYYSAYGIDVDAVLEELDNVPISIHCWQGDDVLGFEKKEGGLTGGIQTTGNYPGRARNPQELRADLDVVLSLVPGAKKVNLHASYAETDGVVDRNKLEPKHFDNWVNWAIEKGIGLDFNPTYYSHPLGEFGTLSNADENIRKFWIEHGICSRRIGEYFYKKTGKVCVINHWTPDGDKEFPVDTVSPRLRLKDSYDQIFEATKDVVGVMDGIESKVFGIGLESYTVGSHEFCMAYVFGKNKDHIILTLDTGHYHPTEMVSAKLGSVYAFQNHVLLHISRPVRWDSDHVVAYDDETKAIMEELVRLGKLKDTYIATDYFDASINRVIAWITGLRNTRKAMLTAMLQPVDLMKKVEMEKDFSSRLAITQEFKCAPVSLVWDYYCEKTGVGVGLEWLERAKKYEQDVCLKRN